MHDANSGKQRSLWWLMPVGMLIVMVAGQLWMGYTAVHDPGFALEKNYYKKAVHWDQHQQQAAENQRLGWKIRLRTEPARDASRHVHLIVRLSDAHGAPLRGVRLHVETFFNARAAHLLDATFTETRDGTYQASLPMRHAGLWEFRFTATHLGAHFTDVIRRSVSLSGGA